MKKIKKNSISKLPIYLLFFFTTIFLQSCELFGDDNDEPLQLPEATQSGKNTFGCMINGEPFVVSNTSLQTAIFQQGQLQFGAGGIYILLGDPLEINTNYSISDSVIARYFVNENPNVGCHYNFNDTYQGFIRFSKIDRINYIISGTFEFSTNNDDCEDIKITEGVFDMKYIP